MSKIIVRNLRVPSSWRGVEDGISLAQDRRSFASWLEEKRATGDEPRELMETFVAMLTPMLEFLALGTRRGGRTLAQRAWVLLYSVRPDLVDGETMASAAPRFGAHTAGLAKLVKDLQVQIPALRVETKYRGKNGMIGAKSLAMMNRNLRNRQMCQERKQRLRDAAKAA